MTVNGELSPRQLRKSGSFRRPVTEDEVAHVRSRLDTQTAAMCDNNTIDCFIRASAHNLDQVLQALVGSLKLAADTPAESGLICSRKAGLTSNRVCIQWLCGALPQHLVGAQEVVLLSWALACINLNPPTCIGHIQ